MIHNQSSHFLATPPADDSEPRPNYLLRAAALLSLSVLIKLGFDLASYKEDMAAFDVENNEVLVFPSSPHLLCFH